MCIRDRIGITHIQGNYMKELTLQCRGLIWFFRYTFSHKVLSEIDHSNSFLYTIKSFLNCKGILNSTNVCGKCIQRHYPSANTFNKHQFIGMLLDSVQSTRCKVENKPPTVVGSSFPLIHFPCPNYTLQFISIQHWLYCQKTTPQIESLKTLFLISIDLGRINA